MLAPSQVSTSVTKSENESSVPNEKVTEQETGSPAEDPIVVPESIPIEIETVSEPQYEVEITPPTTDEQVPPKQEEMPQQTPPEPSDPLSETEPTVPQTAPPEVPSEPEIQKPTESVDDCIAYGKEYAVSIGLTPPLNAGIRRLPHLIPTISSVISHPD